MKIYTSNYWKYTGSRGVQISCSKPDTARVYRNLPALYPDWSDVKAWNLVKGLPDSSIEKRECWKSYVKHYWSKLTRIGPETIISYLCDGDVLLCWCSVGKPCHRLILAEWLKRNGVECEEWRAGYVNEGSEMRVLH